MRSRARTADRQESGEKTARRAPRSPRTPSTNCSACWSRTRGWSARSSSISARTSTSTSSSSTPRRRSRARSGNGSGLRHLGARRRHAASRAMNIAVFLDEVMAINGPLLLVPGSHKKGVRRPRCDVLSACSTGDSDAVHAEADTGPSGRRARRHRGAAGPAADVRRSSPTSALPAQDRLCDVLRLLQPITKFSAHGAPRLHADPAGWRRRAVAIRARQAGGGRNDVLLNGGEGSPRSAMKSKRAGGSFCVGRERPPQNAATAACPAPLRSVREATRSARHRFQGGRP